MYTGVLLKNPRCDELAVIRGYHASQRFSLLPHQKQILNAVLSSSLKALSIKEPPLDIKVVEVLAESGLYIVAEPASRLVGTQRFVLPIDALKSELVELPADASSDYTSYKKRDKPRPLVVINTSGVHPKQGLYSVESFLIQKWIASQMSIHNITTPVEAQGVGYVPEDTKSLFYLVRFSTGLLLPLPVSVLAEPETRFIQVD